MSIKSRHPDDYQKILDTCLVYNIRRLSRLTTSSLNQTLSPSGLKCTQFSILVGVGAKPNASMTTIADWLGMDISTLNRSLENLEQLGLVTLTAGKQREKLANLTENGHATLEEFYPLWVAEQKKLTDMFDSGMIARCRTFFRRLYDHMKSKH